MSGKGMPRFAAWLVHLFTASGAVFGLFALDAIHRHEFVSAFWWMFGALVVDGVDGLLARAAEVEERTPGFDGALLDAVVDYLNYVVVPAFFIAQGPLVGPPLAHVAAALVLLASAYQFAQTQAKTADHFFKGFPSLWNIAVFYLYVGEFAGGTSLGIVALLVVLVFLPIKYIYPTRLGNVTARMSVRVLFGFATLLWIVASVAMLWTHPHVHPALWMIVAGYIALYAAASLYRTLVPLKVGNASQG